MHSQSHTQGWRTFAALLLLGTGSMTLAATDSVVTPEAAPKLAATLLLDVDALGVPPADATIDNFPMTLTDAELGLALEASPSLRGEMLLVHEDGTPTVEQAFGTWTGSVGQILFGRLAVAHGSYQARLIHDPLLQQDVEEVATGFSFSRTVGAWTGHLGLVNSTHQTDSVTSVDAPAVFPALDFKWGEAGQARLSARISHHRRDIDAAATIPVGTLAVDLEGVLSDGEWASSDAAWMAGLCWKATNFLDLAARMDGRDAKQGGWTNVVSAGGTLHFAKVAFAGVEWAQELDGEGALTLRMGLQADWASKP